ncbi:MAG: N-acetylmuramoyl-L-alanine amidase [Paludibacteraceae bacterium]|nr:N-acetylmuramoyl-L-alanine amidase [Paludibacteraceae bacterium]
MRKIDSIIIHCSATPEGRDVSADTIRQWHKAKGRQDIGYHYVIRLDGTVEQGRPVEQVGAHCTGHNQTSIGVCYIGGVTSDGKTPKDTRTDAQKASLLALIRRLQTSYRILSSNIYGHYEFANKACPSFDVQEWKRRNNI